MRLMVVLLSLLSLSACSEIQLASHVAKNTPLAKSQRSVGTFKVGNPYKIQGKRYYPDESYDLVQTGIASWYGPQFHGKQTANGEIFDMYELTAAHKTLQMPSIVRVTNLENGRSIAVRVNDRGPYSKGRIIDLSMKSAEALGFKNQGTARVKVQVLKEESIHVAALAKQGQSTNGFEVAVNERLRGAPVSNQAYARNTANIPAQTQQSLVLAKAEPAPAAPPPSVQSQALSAPVTQSAARASSLSQTLPHSTMDANYFVQTGSFSTEQNALNYARQISRIVGSEIQIQPINMNNRQLYRVQVPTQSAQEAGFVLQKLSSAGYAQSMIVKE